MDDLEIRLGDEIMLGKEGLMKDIFIEFDFLMVLLMGMFIYVFFMFSQIYLWFTHKFINYIYHQRKELSLFIS